MSRQEHAVGICRLESGLDVPSVVMPAKELAEAAKAVGARVRITAVGEPEGFATLVGGAGVYAVPCRVPEAPLTRPALPDEGYREVRRWGAVERLLHAAATGKDDRPALRYLALGPSGITATDEVLVARASVDLGLEEQLLVPAEFFHKWPKGKVELAESPGMLIFQVGDEIRLSEVFKGWYPDCSTLIPGSKQWVCHLDRRILTALVLAASRATAQGMVAVGQVGEDFIIQGGEFRAATMVDASQASDWRMTIDGKRFLKAIRATKGPNIELGYHGPDNPLTLWGEAYEEAIYPMIALEATG
jgi:hypothetical protein